MKQNISPSYLTSLIPIPQENRYPLRNRNDIPTIQSRTSLYQESFLPSVIRQWNSLPEDVKSSPTLSIFKHRISLNMQKPPVTILQVVDSVKFYIHVLDKNVVL